MIQAVHSRPAT